MGWGGDRGPVRLNEMCLSWRDRAMCCGGQVLYIVGIVRWHHPRPRRRGAGVWCPERSGLWRPAVGSTRLVVSEYLGII